MHTQPVRLHKALRAAMKGGIRDKREASMEVQREAGAARVAARSVQARTNAGATKPGSPLSLTDPLLHCCFAASKNQRSAPLCCKPKNLHLQGPPLRLFTIQPASVSLARFSPSSRTTTHAQPSRRATCCRAACASRAASPGSASAPAAMPGGRHA
ncbi:hypothetical protein L1887_47875 [Cichorium endivia]|nr:hypothetical protein L1887_47875 [Cichorium endivia]